MAAVVVVQSISVSLEDWIFTQFFTLFYTHIFTFTQKSPYARLHHKRRHVVNAVTYVCRVACLLRFHSVKKRVCNAIITIIIMFYSEKSENFFHHPFLFSIAMIIRTINIKSAKLRTQVKVWEAHINSKFNKITYFQIRNIHVIIVISLFLTQITII